MSRRLQGPLNVISVAVAACLGFTASTPAHGQQAVQWRIQDGGNGHWYEVAVHDTGMTWDTARAAAESSGGYLACLESRGEAAWILSITGVPAAWGSRVGPWLGGYQDTSAADYSEPAGGWRWVNGAAWNFSDWPAGQPDNGFGAETVMHLITNIACGNSGAGRFINDLRPDFSAMGSCEQLPTSFVTEWSADCNDDGIVDYGQCRDGSLSDYNGNNVPDCCESGVPCTVGNYPVQWRVEDGGNGHWYQGRRLPTRITWADALDLARSTGGDLASLGSAAELESVFQRVASRVDLWSNEYSPPFIVGPWIGGRGVNGVWSWTDGSSWGFTNWYPGEGVPSSVEQYVHLYSGIGTQINPSPRWADFWAEPMSRSFLVEWSADCNEDGIVDYGQILDGTFEDANENGVPDTCEIDPCPGDINESGVVNGIDLAAILAYWGTNGGKFPSTDTNQDGIVDAQDLAVVLSGWGNCP